MWVSNGTGQPANSLFSPTEPNEERSRGGPPGFAVRAERRSLVGLPEAVQSLSLGLGVGLLKLVEILPGKVTHRDREVSGAEVEMQRNPKRPQRRRRREGFGDPD